MRMRAPVLWLRLMQRRRVRSDSRVAWCAGLAQCERGGCLCARWVQRGGGVLPGFSCKQGAASRREQRARGPRVLVLEMPLISPQAAVAVAAAAPPLVLGACSRRCRHTARGGGGARRGGGVGVALPVDAVVRGREDAVGLAERSDGLVEVQADERGEVVGRGLRVCFQIVTSTAG